MTAVRVLYIEDDPGLARLVQRQLGRLGHVVETAGDGESGFARIRAGGIDVVALDHVMPGPDGLAVLSAIRTLPDPPPVIFVTGVSESRVAVSALKAGATDYVVKGLGGDFIDLLDAAIRSAMAAVELRRAKEASERAILEARDRFEALAAERQVLMREVNHRVGNSLQLVAAFLHLQANGSASAETREALLEANRRVLAVAQVHRRLYTSDDVKTVALDSYLAALIEDLRDAGEEDAQSELTLDSVPLSVSADDAVTIGVIVTELVINALKYAYPDGHGPVRVTLSEAGTPGRYRLSVEDEGVGRVAAAADAVPPSGIGRTIINAMASKLGTLVNYDDTASGTRVVMEIAVAANGAGPA